MTETTIVLGDQELTVPPDTWVRLVSASPEDGIIVGGFGYPVEADIYGQEALLAAELAPEGHLLLNAIIYDHYGEKDGQIWQSTWAWVFPGGFAQTPKYQVQEYDNRIEILNTTMDALRLRLSEISPKTYQCEGVFWAPTRDCLVVTLDRTHKNPNEDLQTLLSCDFCW